MAESLEKSNLEELVEHHKKVINVLHEVSSRVNTKLDLELIFNTTFQLLDDFFRFKHIIILLVKEDSQVLEVYASHGYEGKGKGATVPFGKGVIGMVAKNKKLLRMASVGNQLRYVQQVAQNNDIIPLPGLPNSASQLAVPLLMNEVLVGVLFVESTSNGLFDKRDESLLQMVGVQIAIAINNARQFEIIEDTNVKLQDLNENLELKVKERTQKLAEQNIQLQTTLDELTKTKISRKAITITMVLGIALFILEELLVSPMIDNYFNNNLLVSITTKGVIALLLKPIESIIESFMLSSLSRRKKNQRMEAVKSDQAKLMEV
jgi:transcriptional regulator with GAF, ATPase, and Fis domain